MTPDTTIVTVEAIPVVVTGDRDFRISEGGTRTRTSVILRLPTEEEGLEGNAEIVSAPSLASPRNSPLKLFLELSLPTDGRP